MINATTFQIGRFEAARARLGHETALTWFEVKALHQEGGEIIAAYVAAVQKKLWNDGSPSFPTPLTPWVSMGLTPQVVHTSCTGNTRISMRLNIPIGHNIRGDEVTLRWERMGLEGAYSNPAESGEVDHLPEWGDTVVRGLLGHENVQYNAWHWLYSTEYFGGDFKEVSQVSWGKHGAQGAPPEVPDLEETKKVFILGGASPRMNSFELPEGGTEALASIVGYGSVPSAFLNGEVVVVFGYNNSWTATGEVRPPSPRRVRRVEV